MRGESYRVSGLHASLMRRYTLERVRWVRVEEMGAIIGVECLVIRARGWPRLTFFFSGVQHFGSGLASGPLVKTTRLHGLVICDWVAAPECGLSLHECVELTRNTSNGPCKACRAGSSKSKTWRYGRAAYLY